MKAIIANTRADGTQIAQMQIHSTNSTAQNAAAWGETAAQTYATSNRNSVPPRYE